MRIRPTILGVHQTCSLISQTGLRPALQRDRTTCKPLNYSPFRPPGFALLAALPLVESTITSSFSPITYVSELLLASPLPSYGLTIIVLALLLRSTITLPVTLWQRRRYARLKELAEPQVQQFNQKIATELVGECRRRGLSHEAYRSMVKEKVADYQSALYKKYKTHPTITTWAPFAVSIPLLVVTSLTIRNALAIQGSAMAAESFLWIPTLLGSDTFLAFTGALVAFTNAEVASRRRSAIVAGLDKSAVVEAPTSSETLFNAQSTSTSPQSTPSTRSAPISQPRSRATPPPKRPSQLPSPALSSKPLSRSTAPPKRSPPSLSPTSSAQPLSRSPSPTPLKRPPLSPSSSSKRRLSTSNPPPLTDIDPAPSTKSSPAETASFRNSLITGVMRVSGLVFFAIASSAPSGMALYWVTSMTFTLGQTIVLHVLDRRKLEKLQADPKPT